MVASKRRDQPLQKSSVKGSNYNIDPKLLRQEIFGDLIRREWQEGFLEAIDAGKIWQFLAIIGRRGGKTSFILRCIVYLLLLNPGWRAQSGSITFKMIDEIIRGTTDDGEPMLGFIPEKYIAQKVGSKCNEIWFVNNSSLHWDGLEIKRGKNMRGKGNNIIMLDEYAFIEHAAEIYAAVVGSFRQKQQKYVFIASTPNGRSNDFYEKYLQAEKYPQFWHMARATIEDYMEPEARAEYIEQLRSQGLTESDIQRELYASFEAASRGAILDDVLSKFEVKADAYNPNLPVHTGWDLGWTDKTVIWAFQHLGRNPATKKDRFVMVNSLQGCTKSMEEYAFILSEWGNKYGYWYGEHGLPHDADDHSGMVIESRAMQLQKALLQQGHSGFHVNVIRKAFSGAVRSGVVDSRMRMFFMHTEWVFDANCTRDFHELKADFSRDHETREMVRNNARHLGDGLRTAIDLIVTRSDVFNGRIKEVGHEWLLD